MNTILTPEQDARYADPALIQRVMRDAKTVAVVGLSKDPQKASHFVATYLQAHGYRVVPVNPTLSGTLLGETVYPTLDAIPSDVKIDLVDVFRGANHTPEIARQAVAIGARALWLQLRIVSDEAARDRRIRRSRRGHGPLHQDGARALRGQPALGGDEHRPPHGATGPALSARGLVACIADIGNCPRSPDQPTFVFAYSPFHLTLFTRRRILHYTRIWSV